ncbi:glycosyl transferase family 90 [Tepidamorphus sp. 3E244]|uniref:glycosyl transferase family 90 n=1 Tax=Tepidamorphus sp. 3E244 TaxID=3385498 RepID=UPI0038FC8921
MPNPLFFPKPFYSAPALPYRRARFRHKLNRAVKKLAQAVSAPVSVPDISIADWAEHPSIMNVRLTRTSSSITAHLPDWPHDWMTKETLHRLPAFIYLLARCPAAVDDIVVDLSDGDWPGAGLLSPSSFRDDVILVPDPIFYSRRAYAEIRNSAATITHDWRARRTEICWRGSDTGCGARMAVADATNNPLVRQRLRAALLLKDHPACDMRFIGSEYGPTYERHYEQIGVLGEWVAPDEWLKDRYGLVFDGHSNSWSSFMERMLQGCCVIKADSPFGYRQWYYDRLTPWEHYVPVRADLSDLTEKVDWARANEDEAEAIAANGKALAWSMTLKSETDDAVARITRHFGVTG